MDPRDLAARETLAFIGKCPVSPGERLLDVGCGDGRIDAGLAAAGFSVAGIDLDPDVVAEARARGVAAIAGDFLEFHIDPVDIVLFARSLHHIHAIDRAVARAHDVLRPRGALLCDELAIDRADSRTERWLDERLAALDAAGLVPHRTDDPELLGPLARWRAVRPPLHGGRAVLRAIEKRFDVIRTEDAPYLFRYVCDRIEASGRGWVVAERVLSDEERAIAAGRIAPLALRVIARRPD